MKRIVLLLALFPALALAQTKNCDMDVADIAASEMMAAQHAQHTPVILSQNTGNYDLKYHRLELNIDPDVDYISGTVTSHFEAKNDLSSIVFELMDNMTVTGVERNGVAYSYTHANNEIAITLPSTQTAGTLDSLAISYQGVPNANGGFGSFEQTTHAGEGILWTLSEPYGAIQWWPCKQNLDDKIDRVDVELTVPDTEVGVSNGLLRSETVVGTNKIYKWRHDYPIPAYLVAIAVTNYVKYTDVVGSGANALNIDNYVWPETLAQAQASTPVTVDMMNLFETEWEPYPFRNEKYGHAQFGWGGGMEHTTISFMGNFSRNLIAHELAHQWFGDKITCGSWQDIWLQESWATYATGRAIQVLEGEPQARTWRQQRVNQVTSQPGGSVYINNAADTLSVSRVFNQRLSYNKGAMVLHGLRKVMGETAFIQGTRDYLADPNLAFGYAKTPDFIGHMETAYGAPLTEFFNDWIYGEGYPTYNVQYSQNGSGDLTLDLTQTQSHSSVSYFEGPLTIRAVGASGQTQDFTLDVQADGQFVENIPFDVASIILDPDIDLISAGNTVALGLNDLALRDLHFYPNPAAGTLYWTGDLTLTNVSVTNALGQVLIRQEAAQDQLDLSSLTTGLYFVTATVDGRQIQQRVAVR